MFDFFDPKADMHIHSKCEPKIERYVIYGFQLVYKMSSLELCLSLIKVPIAVFNFTLTLDNCFVHCKCSSKSAPRYLTDCLDISHFPCSFLN